MNTTSTPSEGSPETPAELLSRLAWDRFPNCPGLTNASERRDEIRRRAAALIEGGADAEDALDEAQTAYDREHVVVNGWHVPTYGRALPSDFGVLALRAIEEHCAGPQAWGLSPDEVTLAPLASPAHDRWMMVKKRDGLPADVWPRGHVTLAGLLKLRVRKRENALVRPA
ncbi:hypothetical protein JOD31_001051 [Methylopila capsulata]|uniref:Uncharacterized protein n=1 Tax=Methylopila capsulata TaxID=61654 RepID=A0A9W6ITC6_9HYPH|nr:hypothetical protein [Methylopila capsulata]MBM7850839.1 hypothetical protein [Methylopila capsulata]GLK56133.1 hypothetical protein GCM10008170_21520 [Methylopila capsulata]